MSKEKTKEENKNKEKIKSLYFLVKNAMSDLVVWLFASFLLPLIQWGILCCLKNHPSTESVAMFNVLFVTIASFLTNVFFFTAFWKKKSNWMRMALIISYVLALTLFIISLLEVTLVIRIFDRKIYEIGMYIALALAIIVGFSSKYDENKSKALLLAQFAKERNDVLIDGEDIEL